MTNKGNLRSTHIYYTEVYELSSTKLAERRVSLHPNQYRRLLSIHGDENVVCRRMNLNTGEWEDYPLQDTE